MPSNSRKLICPRCYQIVRSTDPKALVVCGCCSVVMVSPPPRPCPPEDIHDPDVPEPSLEDRNRTLDA